MHIWVIETLREICTRMYTSQSQWEGEYPDPDTKEGDIWEHVCATMMLLHGRPPPFAGWHPEPDRDSEEDRRKAYIRRNDWIMAVEDTLRDRFRLHPGHYGPFIAAYEKWCSETMEE